MSRNLQSTGASGAFRQVALTLFDMGLAPIPTGGDDGKKPLRRNYQKTRYGAAHIAQLKLDLPAANVALVCGLSRLNVVDVDEPGLLASMVDRFGPTPLITQTGGRNGYQMFYGEHPDVRPVDLRDFEGLAVEVKAQGNIVVVPPSVNFKTGRPYTFHVGDWNDLRQLPRFRVEALGVARADLKSKVVQRGERNRWLFRQCLSAARACDDLDALLDVARTRAGEWFDEAMPDAEIARTARSAWGYERQGRNWFGKGHFAVTRDHLMHVLSAKSNGADAWALYTFLRIQHGAYIMAGQRIALATASMSDCDVIPGWGRKRYQGAIETLINLELLELVRQGAGRGNPNLYLVKTCPGEARDAA